MLITVILLICLNILNIKVHDKTYTLEELKTAAMDKKKLRPIQEAIIVALRLKFWEKIPETINSRVTANNLARFMVSRLIIIPS